MSQTQKLSLSGIFEFSVLIHPNALYRYSPKAYQPSLANHNYDSEFQ